MRIYVASSWRNPIQPKVVNALREDPELEVYDFRNPAPGDNGFSWEQIDPVWGLWTETEFRDALEHAIANDGFKKDMTALKNCDLCILVLPSGRSAHLEAGYATGAGKPTIIYLPTGSLFEPELMYKMANGIVTTMNELLYEVQGYKHEMQGNKQS